MSNLICGKAAVGGNYNSTRDTMPLVLGSIISFAIFFIYPVIIAKRIRNEEAVLEKDLNGYIEYKKKVKYKVIPFIW